MGYQNYTREELENLYSQQGITRKELRYLLRISPNKIPDRLSQMFRKELNPFKLSNKHNVELRGFIHSAPKKILRFFNSIHYELNSEIGGYNLLLLSSSPINTEVAIPIVISKSLSTSKDLSKAHFTKITGSTHYMSDFKKCPVNGFFIICNDLNLLGFDELFSISDPDLTLADFSDMIRNRYNTTELLTKGILLWLMSSPIYEGRAGGNAFSPISPYDQQYKCDVKVLDEFQKELVSIPLPYFSQSHGKARKSMFDYNVKIKTSLKYFDSGTLNYKYESNLKAADKFLDNRPLGLESKDLEMNISTTSLILDSLKTRPLETFVLKPLVPAKVLTHTDLPILFTNEDLIIDEADSEIMDYSMDINQLIYQANLTIPKSPFDPIDTAGAVKGLMEDIRRSFFELHELMIEGIIFNPGYIGGLGEHLTRIANSVLRANNQMNEHEALNRSEELYSEMINKLVDEFSTDIKNFYYLFEEKRTERDQIKTHKLRTTVNSVLFELNNSYKDGWAYEIFESELKKRTRLGAAKTREIFDKLKAQKEVTERSPGLYWQILGFDRYM